MTTAIPSGSTLRYQSSHGTSTVNQGIDTRTRSVTSRSYDLCGIMDLFECKPPIGMRNAKQHELQQDTANQSPLLPDTGTMMGGGAAYHLPATRRTVPCDWNFGSGGSNDAGTIKGHAIRYLGPPGPLSRYCERESKPVGPC